MMKERFWGMSLSNNTQVPNKIRACVSLQTVMGILRNKIMVHWEERALR